MGHIYNNVAHEEIDILVEKDLEKYGQHNQCPKSLTVVEGDMWRHYELGAIYGFVLYNEKDADGDDRFRIASICESDEHWFAPVCGMLVDAAWTNAINETWQRMVSWRNAHIRQGWEENADISNPQEYKNLVISPIVPEVVEWDDVPDNAVLGSKYTTLQ